MARKKTNPQKRQARAGNRKVAKLEKGSLEASDKINHTDDTIGLQERALVLYKEWMTEDGDDEGNCLGDRVPAPDLADIKRFIRFYIDSSKGQFFLKPVVSSVLNFAARFFAGFTRVTKTKFEPKDTSDVYHWIRRTLTKDGIIEDKIRQKNVFAKRDLIELLASIWTKDDPMFIHERNRVQITYIILIFCFSGARIGAYVPDTSKAKRRGIRYKDVELFLMRAPDGGWTLGYRLDQAFLKNNQDPEDIKFGISAAEHQTLIFNAALFLLTLAFADNALVGYKSPADLWKEELSEGENERLLRWKPNILEKPILRTVTADAGVSDDTPLTRVKFCEVLRAALENAGFFGRITIHAIRRGLGTKLEKRANGAEHSQISNESNGRTQIASSSPVYGQAAFLEEKALSCSLPAEMEDSISQNPEIQELESELRRLTRGPADKSEISTAKSKVSLRRKQLREEALRQYREEWIRKRRDWKIVSREEEPPKDPIKTEIVQDLFRVMPERARIAAMMTSMRLLSMEGRLKAVEDLLSLCTRDLEVMYRPKEEPINGECPVQSCRLPMENLERSQRSTHIHACKCRDFAGKLGKKEHELNYCFQCFDWFHEEQAWEMHCQQHLTSITSHRCEITMYRHTLIRPGYCAFCLSDSNLSASSRMQQWTKSNDLWNHLETHINEHSWPSSCPHPRCDIRMDDAGSFCYHLSDIHGFRRQVWSRRGMRHHFKEKEEKSDPYVDDDPDDEGNDVEGKKRKNSGEDVHGGKKQRVEIPPTIERINHLPFAEWQQPCNGPLQANSLVGSSTGVSYPPFTSFNNGSCISADVQMNQHHLNTHYNIPSNMMASHIHTHPPTRHPITTLPRHPKTDAEGTNWTPLGLAVYHGASNAAVSDPYAIKDMTGDDLIDPLLRWDANKPLWDPPPLHGSHHHGSSLSKVMGEMI